MTPEMFKEKVFKILPRDAIKALVILTSISRVLNIFKEVSLSINDL